MRNILRKLRIPILGAAAAIALAVPATAHAATADAVTPALTPGECQNFTLQSVATGQSSFVNQNNLLDFSATKYSPLCQELIPDSSTIVEIRNPNGNGECLAFNSIDENIYVHNASGCNTWELSYTQWRFVAISSGVYEVKSLYNGECILLNGPATLATCDKSNEDEQFLYIELIT